jgi:hypothetical protein
MQKKFDFDRGDLFHFSKSGPVQTGRPPLGEGAVSRRSRFRLCDWDPKISEMGPLSHEMAVIQGQNLVVVG